MANAPGLKPVTADALEETQAHLQLLAKPPKQDVGNIALATNMEGPAFLRYGIYRYKVPPVPYKLGMELEELKFRFEQLVDADESIESIQEMALLFNRAVGLFHKLVQPVFPVQRLLWRFIKNPFLDASPADIGTLLYFFSSCRMRSVVRLEGSSVDRKSRSPMTQQTT